LSALLSGYLLDANALIALCWPAHEHHPRMLAWFKTHAAHGWATCALTQGAFIRVVMQPAFSGPAAAKITVTDAAELLLRNTNHAQHRFVNLDFGFPEVVTTCTGGLHGHRQITDAYLLTAALKSSMKLLSFDAGIPSLLATQAERQTHIRAP
jgi:toxin-antitoxin system PIN domain toxin